MSSSGRKRDPLDRLSALDSPDQPAHPEARDVRTDKILPWTIVALICLAAGIHEGLRLYWPQVAWLGPAFWLSAAAVCALVAIGRAWKLRAPGTPPPPESAPLPPEMEMEPAADAEAERGAAAMGPAVHVARGAKPAPPGAAAPSPGAAAASVARSDRTVGQMLDDLRALGYRVYHDLDTRGRGTVDHALIGPAGVFAIEAKTIARPAHGRGRIDYDGQRVRINGRNPVDFGARDPLEEAQAAAEQLRKMLSEGTGQEVAVRPVLLYPGWWVSEPRKARVWVLNPERLALILRDESQTLHAEQIRFLGENLEKVMKGGGGG